MSKIIKQLPPVLIVLLFACFLGACAKEDKKQQTKNKNLQTSIASTSQAKNSGAPFTNKTFSRNTSNGEKDSFRFLTDGTGERTILKLDGQIEKATVTWEKPNKNSKISNLDIVVKGSGSLKGFKFSENGNFAELIVIDGTDTGKKIRYSKN